MTVLIAKNTKQKITLGADTCVFYGETSFKRCLSSSNEQLKIFSVNDIFFSSTGLYSEMINFGIFCQSRKPESNTQIGIQRFFIDFLKWIKDSGLNDKIENRYFIVFEKKLFHFHGNGGVQEIKEDSYAVDGAGFREAYMAMYLGKSVKESIELVMKLNVWAGGEVQIVEVEK